MHVCSVIILQYVVTLFTLIHSCITYIYTRLSSMLIKHGKISEYQMSFQGTFLCNNWLSCKTVVKIMGNYRSQKEEFNSVLFSFPLSLRLSDNSFWANAQLTCNCHARFQLAVSPCYSLDAINGQFSTQGSHLVAQKWAIKKGASHYIVVLPLHGLSLRRTLRVCLKKQNRCSNLNLQTAKKKYSHENLDFLG